MSEYFDLELLVSDIPSLCADVRGINTFEVFLLQEYMSALPAPVTLHCHTGSAHICNDAVYLLDSGAEGI